MKKRYTRFNQTAPLILAGLLFAALIWLLWTYVPRAAVRYGILAVCIGIFLLAELWVLVWRRQISRFADEVCGTLDAAIAGREPDTSGLYEDSLTAKVQGKLRQFYDLMGESRQQSLRDKEIIQSLVSDISHQVKTPVAGMRLYAGILKNPRLSAEKRQQSLETMEAQLDKLDFLMQSLIKMSRLETGTFVLHPEKVRLNDTIALAMSTVWVKAEQKGITLTAQCAPDILVRHDPKWTAEAIGNLLDNGVKYTQPGGSVSVEVSPWQFYTRVDIRDTGIGISEEDYHRVFQRFYRAQETSQEEGVGLGLYLANGIITRQKGYISVKSQKGEGTVFSVYLLNEG